MASMKDWSRAVEMLIYAVEELGEQAPLNSKCRNCGVPEWSGVRSCANLKTHDFEYRGGMSAKEHGEAVRQMFKNRGQEHNLDEFLACMEQGS